MKKIINDLAENKGFMNFVGSMFAIFAGLLFGLIILMFTNMKEAFPAFLTILQGGFAGGTRGLGQVILSATPIILTGLAVGFAFKTGLFNIGVAGQFITGAYAAVYIGIKWTFLPKGIHWIVAILAAALIGGLWASIPGALKAYFNVNEVIATIMMNYIGMYLVNMSVKQYIFDQLKNQSKNIAKSALLPMFNFGGVAVGLGFFIAILMCIVAYIILSKTTFGFELTACGLNRDAADYAGINSKRNILLSMLISGAFAGLGGGIMYLTGSGLHIEVVDVLSSEAFRGIPVALLGLSNPIGILFSGVFISYIGVGGFYMQRFNFVQEIIDIIVSAIIYFSAFSLIFKNIITSILKRSKEGN